MRGERAVSVCLTIWPTLSLARAWARATSCGASRSLPREVKRFRLQDATIRRTRSRSTARFRAGNSGFGLRPRFRAAPQASCLMAASRGAFIGGCGLG